MTKLSKLAKGNKTMANALKIAEEDRVRITEFCELVEKALGNAGNVRDSEKDTRYKNSYALNKRLFEQLKDWLSSFGKGTSIYNGQFFELGDTPDVFVKHGAKKLDLIMLPEVVIKTTGGKHSIAIDEIAKLPSELRDPIMLFKGSQSNSFVALTELKDKNGNDVIVAVHINNKINRTIINRIASLYSKSDNFGNNHIENYVKQQIEQGNLLDASIIKAPNWFTSKGLQLPKLVQTILNANSSISDSTEKSNSKKEKNSYALGSEDTAELEARTEGGETLEIRVYRSQGNSLSSLCRHLRR